MQFILREYKEKSQQLWPVSRNMAIRKNSPDCRKIKRLREIPGNEVGIML